MYSRLWPIILRQSWPRVHQIQLLKYFHSAKKVAVIKPFLLADIGEGITECEIVQWFIEPEARVEEWDKLCEVTSDKASVEITSRYAGVIKKLHYEAGDMAKVGKALVDIDIQSAVDGEDQDESMERSSLGHTEHFSRNLSNENVAMRVESSDASIVSKIGSNGESAVLATPVVRSLAKELGIDIKDVSGTGQDGRVLEEDINLSAKKFDHPESGPGNTVHYASADPNSQIETLQELTNSQFMMYKTMTKSLSIPHFLYADELNFTSLCELRERLKKSSARNSSGDSQKLSYLPFIIKALSMSLHHYPILNAKIEHIVTTNRPSLIYRNQHNIGIAMDTPSGLLVPVIRNVSNLKIPCIALEIARLQSLALGGKLTTQDLSGGTITVSNIGSIGGTYVSPIIVETQVAILGIGKVRSVPTFSEAGELVKKQVCNFSWSADHRVIEGATIAKTAEIMRGFLENPENMILHLR